MRAPVSCLGAGLLLLLTILALPTGSAAQDLFWIPGSGSWQDAFKWSTTEGGIPGAGPPGLGTRTTIIDDAATPSTITFTADADVKQIFLELTNSEYNFDLGGFALDVRLNLFLEAGFLETNRFVMDEGHFEARTLSATSHALGTAEMTLGPNLDIDLFPNSTPGGGFIQGADFNANGAGASILIEGNVTLNNSVDGTKPPFMQMNDGARMDVVGGILINEGATHIGASMGFDDPTTVGRLEVTDGSIFDTTTQVWVGREGDGTLQVLSGSSFISRGPTTVANESSGIGSVLVEGSSGVSRWTALDQVTIGNAGGGAVTVGASGEMVITQPGVNVQVAEQGSGSGMLRVEDQGLFDTVNSLYLGGSSTSAGGFGDLVVGFGGTATIDGQIKLWENGSLFATGGDVTAGQIHTSSGSILHISGDGSVETSFLDMAAGTNLDLASGELAVVGPGATMLVGGGEVSYGGVGAQPTLRLQDATATVEFWNIGMTAGQDARGVVTGEQATANVSFDLRVGGHFSDASGSFEVLDGGRATAGDDITLAQALNSSGTVVVSGVSGGKRSLLRLSATGSDEEIEVGRRGVGTMDVLDGALVQSLNNFSIGSFAEGDGTTRVSGSSAGIPSQLSVSQDLAIGGFASFDAIGGTGRLIVEAPGEVLVGDLTKIFAAGEGQVHAGARLNTNRLHLIGGSLQNDGIIDVGGTGLTAANGELLVSPTGELVVDGGSHNLGALRLEPGSTFDFRGGSLSFAGGTMQFPSTSYVYGSDSGLPTFEFTQGALAEVTFVWRVGRWVDTAGLTRLRDPGTRLANTGGGAGADLSVGYEGRGFMEIFDGAEVDFNDDVVIGWLAGSLGSVLVSGVDTERARILARGGSDNDMNIGRAGDGDLTVADGALAFAADDVLVASSVTGTGFAMAAGEAGGFKARIEATDDLFVGAGAPPTDFGIGTVAVFDGGEIIVGDGTYVGPGDEFWLHGGTLQTGFLNLHGDPSRLDWQTGTLDLTNSGVFFDATGLLGADFTLGTDMTLRTQGAIEVVDGSTLTLARGTAITNDYFHLENGSTLRGEGSVQASGNVELQGTVEPGNSPGILTLVGSVVMNSTTSTSIEIGGLTPGTEHDQIVVDGDLTLGGALVVSLVNGFALDTGQVFVIADLAGALSGTFGGFPDEALVANIGGVDLFIDYQAGDGNDVALYTAGTAVNAPGIPARFHMSVAPNPFNPITTVMLELPERAQVEVAIYSVRGTLVRRLLARELEAGQHQVRFDGIDEAGRSLASGVYLARVSVDGRQHLHKMTLVK